MAGVGVRLRIAALGGVAALGVALAGAQGKVDAYRSQFQREADPVRKARLLSRLGDAQLDEMRDLVKKESYPAAVDLLEEYRNEVESAHQGLKSSGINAEKKPNGFKHLEIHLRKSLRRLADIVASLPHEQREPFETARGRLEAIDKELIDLLFPRQPGRSEREKPKG